MNGRCSTNTSTGVVGPCRKNKRAHPSEVNGNIYKKYNVTKVAEQSERVCKCDGVIMEELAELYKECSD